MSDEMGTTTTVPTESESRLAGIEQVKHTPEPWKIETDCIVGATADPKWTANIICNAPPHFYESFNHWAANARLIAAAPDMLAALRAAQEALFWYKAEQFEFEPDGVKVGDQVASAIAKAEGRAL